MSTGSEETVRIRYRSYKWDKPFDPNDFMRPEAVTILYENWLQASSELAEIRNKHLELEKENAVLKSEQGSRKRQKWLPFVLQLISLVAIGVGVNLVSASPSNETGWTLISISVTLEIVTFISIRIE